jgi:hypothetical protein
MAEVEVAEIREGLANAVIDADAEPQPCLDQESEELSGDNLLLNPVVRSRSCEDFILGRVEQGEERKGMEYGILRFKLRGPM